MKQERGGQRIADGRGAANTLLKALPPVRHEVILKFYYSSLHLFLKRLNIHHDHVIQPVKNI